MPSLQVKRAGTHRLFRERPFRGWLKEQPRSDLHFKKDIANRAGNGWTIEEFYLEAHHRGLSMLRFYTAASWCRGVQPKSLGVVVRGFFPKVRF